ncbi:MAG: transposase [Saprospiraceae bacterium]|nr:transposase [Saprospiraceae bacterium]
MKKSKFSESQHRAIVAEQAKGERNVAQICEHDQISAAIFYKWKTQQAKE